MYFVSSQAKAFDKKTSVLQYFVKLVKDNDESLLHFKEEINAVEEAKRVMLDMLSTDNKQLFKELNDAKGIVEREKKATSDPDKTKEANPEENAVNASPMELFLVEAGAKMDELSSNIEKMQKSYSKALKVIFYCDIILFLFLMSNFPILSFV